MGAGAALALKTPLTTLDSGGVAHQALGVAGAIAVVIAGWTTSNPTLYRAGLALQAITPDWPRWVVTLVVGVVTTIVACFPFVFTELLNFVGIYGLLLVPAGAIVMTEHWLFPRLGLNRYWAHHRDLILNWPALLAWISGMALALGLYLTDTLHLFFLFLPVYVLTVVLYIVLASVAGARSQVTPSESDTAEGEDHPSAADGRKEASAPETASGGYRATLFQLSGLIALAALIVCAVFAVYVYLATPADYARRLVWFKDWLIAPTLAYFVAATYWQVGRMRSRAQ
jgi:NCS1 family nucleobase:cation symporter-1